MKTFALCCASFRESVRRAAGVEPLLSPPVHTTTFDPRLLERHDFIYLKLHGLPDEVYWYGDRWTNALSADQVRQADLGGAVVFAANCHLPESPMLQALLDAGASAVVGGKGTNLAAIQSIQGADLLGLWVRRGLQIGFGAQRALKIAKLRIRMTHPDPITRDGQAALDALQFEIYDT